MHKCGFLLNKLNCLAALAPDSLPPLEHGAYIIIRQEFLNSRSSLARSLNNVTLSIFTSSERHGLTEKFQLFLSVNCRARELSIV